MTRTRTRTRAKRQAATTAIETGPSSPPGMRPAPIPSEAGMGPAPAAAVPTPAPAAAAPAPASPAPAPARLTRLARLRALLEQPQGAELAELCTAIGWQAHSVRAALSGLRKQGCLIERRPVERAEGDTGKEADTGDGPALPRTATGTGNAPGGFAYHLVITPSEGPDDAPGGNSTAGEPA